MSNHTSQLTQRKTGLYEGERLLSSLTGWHRVCVLCNGWVIASFPTAKLASTFIERRSANFPNAKYQSVEAA